jgi:hypothetical protein
MCICLSWYEACGGWHLNGTCCLLFHTQQLMLSKCAPRRMLCCLPSEVWNICMVGAGVVRLHQTVAMDEGHWSGATLATYLDRAA